MFRIIYKDKIGFSVGDQISQEVYEIFIVKKTRDIKQSFKNSLLQTH